MAKTQSGGFSAKKAYLVLYNAASASAWSVVLFRVASTLLLTQDPTAVSPAVDSFARTTQTFAVMEILHALTGVVPAPVFTTIMQVFSRLVLVWGIAQPFPELTSSAWFSSMLVAWATTEVVRYTYFALKQFEAVPAALHWLRYSGFLVLYPIGITSEVAMIFMALAGPAGKLAPEYPLVLMSILGLYVPGSFILYSHMLTQRKKNLGAGARVAKAKKVQ
ncbi:hypothetical protein QBC39DRAFT_314200 [Podospora conica]|nr:hypothetical protein QBC39DRAFT_314200 [Schizothecium conicum]